MNLTLKDDIEKIFRKLYPTVSLHSVEDFRTQLGPLDAAGLVTKKVQLDIILTLCQHVSELEKMVDDLSVYVRPTEKRPTKKSI